MAATRPMQKMIVGRTIDVITSVAGTEKCSEDIFRVIQSNISEIISNVRENRSVSGVAAVKLEPDARFGPQMLVVVLSLLLRRRGADDFVSIFDRGHNCKSLDILSYISFEHYLFFAVCYSIFYKKIFFFNLRTQIHFFLCNSSVLFITARDCTRLCRFTAQSLKAHVFLTLFAARPVATGRCRKKFFFQFSLGLNFLYVIFQLFRYFFLFPSKKLKNNESHVDQTNFSSNILFRSVKNRMLGIFLS